MRADIHDGPEHMLQSEAGYIDARPLTPARQNLLQRMAGPYIGSKTEVAPLERQVRSTLKCRHRQATSACPFRANARSRCAPARCAGARAERPVAGREDSDGEVARSTRSAHVLSGVQLMIK